MAKDSGSSESGAGSNTASHRLVFSPGGNGSIINKGDVQYRLTMNGAGRGSDTELCRYRVLRFRGD